MNNIPDSFDKEQTMRIPNPFLTVALLLTLLAPPALAATEPGSAIKADEIKAEPFRDAKSVGSVKAGDPVQIVKRDGAWLQIASPKKGWVKMLSIRKGGAAATGASLTGVAALASGRAGTGKIVSTTGIRGLNEEELKNAKFDEKEVKTVESYTVSKGAAEKFAAQGKLKARQVPYLEQ
jgi:hypothetical protein